MANSEGLNGVRAMIQRWWQGRYVPPDPHPTLVFVGHYERHWTARWAQVAWEYFKEHHRWIIGLLIGLLVAMLVKTK